VLVRAVSWMSFLGEAPHIKYVHADLWEMNVLVFNGFEIDFILVSVSFQLYVLACNRLVRAEAMSKRCPLVDMEDSLSQLTGASL
jgi:RIO-like serine/threonine protein kinase